MTPDVNTLLSFNFSYWFLQTIAMLLTCFFIPNLSVRGPLGAFLMVFALGYVNSKVWDAALFLNIPQHFSSQAVVIVLVNGVIFWVLVKVLPWIEVKGVMPALVAPLVFSVSSLLISHYASNMGPGEMIGQITKLMKQASTELSGASSAVKEYARKYPSGESPIKDFPKKYGGE